MLYTKHGRRYRFATADEVLEAAAKYLVAERRGAKITSPEDAVLLARHLAAGRETESFGAIFLDVRHQLIAAETLFHGTVDGVTVYRRVVAERALRYHAAAVIVFHNHPSGDPEPSAQDRTLTRRLREALELLEIRLLDHIVVTNTSYARAV
ncbi:MAG TPA: JAB domain-containing protein [Steroidobacteraceae bacterium]